MTERKGNTYSVSNDVNLLFGMAVEVTGDGYNASPEENFVNSCKHQYQTCKVMHTFAEEWFSRLCSPMKYLCLRLWKDNVNGHVLWWGSSGQEAKGSFSFIHVGCSLKYVV